MYIWAARSGVPNRLALATSESRTPAIGRRFKNW